MKMEFVVSCFFVNILCLLQEQQTSRTCCFHFYLSIWRKRTQHLNSQFNKDEFLTTVLPHSLFILLLFFPLLPFFFAFLFPLLNPPSFLFSLLFFYIPSSFPFSFSISSLPFFPSFHIIRKSMPLFQTCNCIFMKYPVKELIHLQMDQRARELPR